IVNIDSRVSVSAYKSTGSWSGTGFIADSKNGYLVTNCHVVGRASIGTYFITFHNGQQSEAKVVYYDAYADVAILKIDPTDFPKDIETIEFAKEEPKLGEEVFIVGNTEGHGFSFHEGILSNLYEISGEMPQGSYVINMNIAGGASGSPVINSDYKAIGVVYGGSKTYALALRNYYVQHILRALQAGKTTQNRNHIGVITELYSLDRAIKHRNFPKAEIENYINEMPDAKNRVIVVSSVTPSSTAKSVIRAGDILWEVNGLQIGADLTILDRAMNEATDKITLTIYRNGEKLQREVKVYDLEKNKVTKMFDFAGGVFFEADDYYASRSGTPIRGVCLATVQNGSSFSDITETFSEDDKNFYRIMVSSLHGTKISSLDELILVANEAIKRKHINFEYKNYLSYYSKFGGSLNTSHENLTQDITFDSTDAKPRIFKFDPSVYEWKVEVLEQ
ncbi:MAG: serine protease, partial [Chlamydiae bacterium]|nr:serine protease [Chlamydiota bacterium]